MSGERLRMALFFIKRLEDFSYFQEFSEGLALGLAQMRQVRRQTYRLRLVDDRLALLKRPVSGRQIL